MRSSMLLPAILAAALQGTLAAAELPDTSKMNVLLIDIEDCNAGVWGCYGNPICKTPNIDAFAHGGAVRRGLLPGDLLQPVANLVPDGAAADVDPRLVEWRRDERPSPPRNDHAARDVQGGGASPPPISASCSTGSTMRRSRWRRSTGSSSTRSPRGGRARGRSSASSRRPSGARRQEPHREGKRRAAAAEFRPLRRLGPGPRAGARLPDGGDGIGPAQGVRPQRKAVLPGGVPVAAPHAAGRTRRSTSTCTTRPPSPRPRPRPTVS